jgi:CelD/BcsL family acetyltransferase involved in cellulose biosynthesis
MKPRSAQLPDIAVLKDGRDFAALEEEWEDLCENSPLATPFQSWAWLYYWWEVYGEDYELRLVTVRDAGLLVGLIPLMLERRWGFFGRLFFIGTGVTDYLDVIIREEWENKVTEAGRYALQEIDAWQVADLQELRPEAAAWSIFQKWTDCRAYTWQSICPLIDVRPWEELLTSLSRNLRSTTRRTLRRAEKDGAVWKLVEPGDAEQAVRRCVVLHREAWRGRNIALQQSTEKYENYIVAAGSRLVARRLGGISELWLDGEVIASQFLLFGSAFIGWYLSGYKKEASQGYQLSSLLIWDAVNIARSRESAHVDLLRGEEPFKLRWASKAVPNY